MSLLGLELRRRWWRRRTDDRQLAALFDAPLPPRRSRLDTVRLLALDLETTGLDSLHDRILSAAWLTVDAGAIRLADAGDLRLRPERDVGASATIHGLRDIDLAAGTNESTLLAALLPALAGRILLAHGAHIELDFIDRVLRRLHQVPLLLPAICTLRLEARLREQLGEPLGNGSLTLDACRRRHGLPEYRQHEALADALACAELFLAQVELMGGIGRVRLAAVLR